jgi:hypothetical protein
MTDGPSGPRALGVEARPVEPRHEAPSVEVEAARRAMLSACPLCGTSDLARCLSRERVPVFQNVHYPSARDAAAATTGRLEIVHCNGCGFVFNAAFDLALAVYSPNYENDQTVSDTFRGYLDRIADRVLGAVAPSGSPIVLEVGCGQGHFLKRLAALPAAHFNRFVGFDPAWRGDKTPSGFEIRPQLFDAAATRAIGSPIGAIVSRHVIEHVCDPVAFLREIRAAIGDTPGITLMLETPCLEWIARNAVMFDFFYEHCSYFTRETLMFALQSAGYRINRFERVFNDQYLWVEASLDESDPAVEPPRPIGLGERIAGLGTVWQKRLIALRDELAGHRAAGGVALWGAGAKGATLAGLADADATLIDCLIDINPRKQGNYLAGTAHPIVAPRDAAARGVRTVLLLNPNYRDEVARMVHDQGLPFTIHDAA